MSCLLSSLKVYCLDIMALRAKDVLGRKISREMSVLLKTDKVGDFLMHYEKKLDK